MKLKKVLNLFPMYTYVAIMKLRADEPPTCIHAGKIADITMGVLDDISGLEVECMEPMAAGNVKITVADDG